MSERSYDLDNVLVNYAADMAEKTILTADTDGESIQLGLLVLYGNTAGDQWAIRRYVNGVLATEFHTIVVPSAFYTTTVDGNLHLVGSSTAPQELRVQNLVQASELFVSAFFSRE